MDQTEHSRREFLQEEIEKITGTLEGIENLTTYALEKLFSVVSELTITIRDYEQS